MGNNVYSRLSFWQILNYKEICLTFSSEIRLIIFQTFGESSITITLGVWFEKANYLALRNSVFIEIKEAFDREGIEIPFPHINVYAGETSKPIGVKLLED